MEHSLFYVKKTQIHFIRCHHTQHRLTNSCLLDMQMSDSKCCWGGGEGEEQPDISLCECHSVQPVWGCEPAFPEVEYKGHRHILWPYSLPNDFNTNACTTSQTVLCCQQSYNINLNWSTMNAHQPENM